MSRVTLAVDRAFEWPLTPDRRGVAGEPRRSWASPQPVEHRTTPFNDTAVGVQPWAKLAAVYQRRTIALDVAASFAVSVALLLALGGTGLPALPVAAAVAVGFVALVACCQGYDVRRLGDGPEEFQSVLRAGALGVGLLVTVSYLSAVEISRALVLLGVPALVLASAGVRYTHRRFLHAARASGLAMKRTLVVGAAGDVSRVARDLSQATFHGYQVTGVCVPSLGNEREVAGIPIVGAIADVAQVVVDRVVDVVVVAGPTLSGEALRRLSWALDRVGAQLVVVPDLVEVTGPRISYRPAAGLSLLEVEVAAPRGRLLAKTVLDRAAGTAILVAASPVIGVAALLVRLTSRGPAFYRQTRVGVDGAPFTMWKLRSMYADADKRLAELGDRSDGNGVLFKMRRDPRITPIGRVLRRYSLDELPQLWNVVRGDMSLVGPRPPLGEEVARYEDAVHRRLRVRPGLTGLWQVSGRSDLSWEESVRLDLRYVDNWSVAMDLMILWKTVRAVVRGAGAY